jgi:hypothetical protein
MVQYLFRIRQGSHSRNPRVDLLDDEAAWEEAAAACSDMIRDTIERLSESPEWRLEVVNEAGTIRHLFRVTTRDLQITVARSTQRPSQLAAPAYRPRSRVWGSSN